MKPYLLEIKCEFLFLLRMPRFSVSTIVLPLLFYAFFGLSFAKKGSAEMPLSYLAAYSAWGVMAVSLWGIASTIASERGLGWLQVKRASPMPPLAYFVAKVASALLFSTLVIICMFAMASVFGGVHMPLTRWLLLASALLGGAVPFCALGFLLGYLMGPTSAPGVVNLIFLPMMFCSGIWIPIQYLPQVIQHLAPALPAYHLAQLSFAIAGISPHPSPGANVEALFAFVLIFGGIAWLAWKREETNVYG